MTGRARLLLCGSTTLVAFSAGGYLAASGMADGTTPPPITVTTPTPSVSVPNPLPAPQPNPTPAPKPVSKPHTPTPAPAPAPAPSHAPTPTHPQATPTPTPTPVPSPTYATPSASTQTVVPARHVTRARHARPAAKRTRAHVHRRSAHKQRAATHVKNNAKPTAQETAPDAEHLTGGHSRLLLYLFAGLLLAVGAATVLWSPRLRRTAATGSKSSGGRMTRRPREVVAEFVHVPTAVSPAAPALMPPTNGNSAAVITEPDFDTALLLPTQDDSGEPAPIEPAAPTEEFCEIAIWRGYAKSRFYARLELPGGDDIAVGESKIFGLRGRGEPARTRAAEEAHHGLVTALLEEGWEAEPTSDTGPWYATRFRRLVAVDEDAIEYALDT